MGNLPSAETIMTRNNAFGAFIDATSLAEIKILIEEMRKGLYKRARAERTEMTRYLALTATALEEAEGWLLKAQMEE